MTRPLYCLRHGRGPAVLLLHGIGSSATAWETQIELLGRDFRCIAPDLPGYGNSPDPAGTTLEAQAEAVIALLDDEPAHLVGVSFGALLALAIARSHAPRVRTLVLADATLGRADLSEEARSRWLAARQAIADDLAGRSRERAAEIASPRADATIIEAIATHMRRARPIGYMTVARIIAGTDARPWLPGIAMPTRVLCGSDDTVTGAAMSRTLVEQIPGATMRTIEGAGHAPHLERPAEFADSVRTFLAGSG